jgi:hypothetical protein
MGLVCKPTCSNFFENAKVATTGIFNRTPSKFDACRIAKTVAVPSSSVYKCDEQLSYQAYSVHPSAELFRCGN